MTIPGSIHRTGVDTRLRSCYWLYTPGPWRKLLAVGRLLSSTMMLSWMG